MLRVAGCKLQEINIEAFLTLAFSLYPLAFRIYRKDQQWNQ
jgi:hypothetical protein